VPPPPPTKKDDVSDSYTIVGILMVVLYNAITCCYSLLHVLSPTAQYGP